ncbi:hypothetical protein WOLCODRAFT_135279 [Wolfiporia cocos MD-104 SS10]|uniref:Uncharacterized protein n=1 Tax=Wolfiporia cocos (strain MD-104) TaxID=742152 RepID=A0A2H3J4P6_WOLCO|nr:hypothetical protein WOLCODRAFT_135279 [Wolfiporia cocos MD-104 SS10]
MSEMHDQPMDIEMAQVPTTGPQPEQPQAQHTPAFSKAGGPKELDLLALAASTPQVRDPLRDILVKVHIRRPERDSWTYLGRAIVSQEGDEDGQVSHVVVRSATSHKILVSFGEDAAVQAEKRGNFVVVGCVESHRVVSWSFNAQNNSETLRLLATIDLVCHSHKSSLTESSGAHRRRIARMIKDDRKRRHRRRRDQDAMVAAFARTGLSSDPAMGTPETNAL